MNNEKSLLYNWYLKNARDLPWRKSQDPYKIWISEVMLQQTTVKAVIPFFEKFIDKFPNVQSLALSPLEEVYEYWAGLGYYSRARNLHKSAQLINNNGFPKKYLELLPLPGFGPYSARSVASLAFDEPVGVLDGNVIRFLTRFYNLKVKHWENKERIHLQTLADSWVQGFKSSIQNQALIEMGATICTPQNPSCLICPVQKSCLSFKNKTQSEVPLKKPRKTKEIWIWEAQILQKKNKIAYVENDYAPFLKRKILFPGKVKKSSKPPKVYDYKHNITHHEIYVKLDLNANNKVKTSGHLWYTHQEIKKIHPVTLIQKALEKLSH